MVKTGPHITLTQITETRKLCLIIQNTKNENGPVSNASFT
jgi:hypothetical protein